MNWMFQSRGFQIAFSLGLGILAGVFFHFVLFRIGLPAKPFIYMAF